MPPRRRATFSYDDALVCVRKGYSHVSPQACIEMHVKQPDMCVIAMRDGERPCKQHVVATDQMLEATDMGFNDLVQIASAGLLGAFSNPLIREESKPDLTAQVVIDSSDDDKEGTKIVNSRIIYINGRRIRQGLALDFKTTGTMTERNMVLVLDKAFVDAAKDVREISVDEFVNGRLQMRYEWIAEDKNSGPPMAVKHSRDGKEVDAMGFRMFPNNADTFVRN